MRSERPESKPVSYVERKLLLALSRGGEIQRETRKYKSRPSHEKAYPNRNPDFAHYLLVGEAGAVLRTYREPTIERLQKEGYLTEARCPCLTEEGRRIVELTDEYGRWSPE